MSTRASWPVFTTTWHSATILDNQNDEAAVHYARALELRVQLSREHPHVVAYQKAVAKTHHDMGLLFRREGRWADADHSFRDALSVLEQLVQHHRGVNDLAVELASASNNLGYLASDQGMPQGSVDWHTRAIQDLTAVVQSEPQHTEARRLLAQAYSGRARSLTNLGNHGEALADWNRSLQYGTEEVEPGTRVGRATAIAYQGGYLEAIAETDRLTPRKGGGRPLLIDCARVYAVAAAACVDDPSLDAAEKLALGALASLLAPWIY